MTDEELQGYYEAHKEEYRDARAAAATLRGDCRCSALRRTTIPPRRK